MKKHYLSICAIVKNEARYLEEWIAFHQIQGVDHFFIYDHESTDDTLELLKRYETAGIVTIGKATGHAPQLPTYQKCIDVHGYSSKWMAFLDADEFLYANYPKSFPLKELLRSYEGYSAVAVNWVLYGSNGLQEYDPRLVIERFTDRAKEADSHVKTILQPAMELDVGKNAHYFKLRTPAVNENKVKLPPEYYHTDPSVKKLRVNHYHTKSEAEYKLRKASGVDVDGVNRNSPDRFAVHNVGGLTDLSAAMLAPLVHEKIAANKRSFLEVVWSNSNPWQVKDEFIPFMQFILDNKIKRVLEIGCHRAGTATALLQLGCDVTSIDIVKQPEVREAERKGLKFFLRDEFNPDGKYDLIFIDGDHSYDGCKKDYQEYKGIVKKGGFIAFHDVVKSDLHIKQQCGVWQVLEELDMPKIDFITDGYWGGISIIKV